MALIKCPKCGKEFSDRAESCPQCGTTKEEVLRLIKEQEEREAAERERIRKEQEAEEARIRAEWWAANKKKIIIAIFLFILIIAAIIGIRSCMTFMGKCGERLFWYYNSSNKTLTIKGSGPMKNFKSINYLSYNPDSTDAVPWRVYRKEIQNIVLDEDITTIGDLAFSSCSSLHSVNLSSNLEIIGRGAFESCYSLSNITFPSSLKTIEDNAFFYCIGLTSMTIPNSVTDIKGWDAFEYVANIVYSGLATGAPWGARSLNGYVEGNLVYRDKTKTELLACSGVAKGEIIIPNSVTCIGKSAFTNCDSLTSITIPNSVTNIGRCAFFGCHNLTSITIPNSVMSIECDAFENVANIVYSGLAAGAPWGARSLNGYVEGNLVYRDAAKTELLACFATAKGEIIIPNSVTCIGTSAFSGCSGLTSLTIGDRVTHIDDYALYGCSNVSLITIKAATPPTIGKRASAFDRSMQKRIPIYVPAASMDAYRHSKEWADFTNIQVINE